MNIAKGRAWRIPPQIYVTLRFASGYATLFLRLCDLVSKTATKATTPNCVPQWGDMICIWDGCRYGSFIMCALCYNKGNDKKIFVLNCK